MTDKERFIERQTKNIKAHSWYVDYPIEKCRQMAEYLWNQFNSMKEPREITPATYERR